MKVKLELKKNWEDITHEETLNVFIKDNKCSECGSTFTKHKENKKFLLECKECKSKISVNFDK